MHRPENVNFQLHFNFALKSSPPLLCNSLVWPFHLIVTRQITHTSLSSISLHSYGVFKDKVEQQQKHKAQLKLYCMWLLRKSLATTCKKHARIWICCWAQEVYTDADHVHCFSANKLIYVKLWGEANIVLSQTIHTNLISGACSVTQASYFFYVS